MGRKYVLAIFLLLIMSACTLQDNRDVLKDNGPVYDNNEQDPDILKPVENQSIIEKKFPVPIMDLVGDEKYKGESGGLYGNGLNIPPESHRNDALTEISKIRGLDKDGNPSDYGKIGFIAVGFTTTKSAFDRFIFTSQSDDEIRKSIVLINGAQDGKDAYQWSTNPAVMTGLRQAVDSSGITPQQVQVAWIYLTNYKPLGKFPYEADKFNKYIYSIVLKLKTEYPNLKIVYMSSDIYGGYSDPTNEPYAYEYAFAIKWLIKDQINGNTELNYNPNNGRVKAPILLWGPYLWANGDSSRSDGLKWEKKDYVDNGIDTSYYGDEKIAKLLADFFKNNDLAQGWFLEKK